MLILKPDETYEERLQEASGFDSPAGIPCPCATPYERGQLLNDEVNARVITPCLGYDPVCIPLQRFPELHAHRPQPSQLLLQK
jgi:hypothetical protein